MDMQTQSTLNGLNKQQMVDTIGAIQGNPSLANFVFRARNQWISGGENRSTIRDFYGAGAEDTSRNRDFVYTTGNHRSCWAATRGQTRSSTCCTRWPAV